MNPTEPQVTGISALAQSALALLQANPADGKYVEIYFTPDEHYADSFLRGHRAGGGFLGLGAPKTGAEFDHLELNITGRPGVIDPGWAGYTIVISGLNTVPKLETIQYWPESGGQQDAPPDTLARLLPQLAALLQQPILPQQPPREAPEDMF